MESYMVGTPDPPNRIGVLADPYLSRDQVCSLQYAIENTGANVPLVIVNDPDANEIDQDLTAQAINERPGIATARVFLNFLRQDGAWAFVYAERKIAEDLGLSRTHSNRTHVEDISCLSDAEFRYVIPIQDGVWSELPPEAVTYIQEHCDVAVRFGFGLLRGKILDAPEFGVLSFHPADIRKYRGLGTPQAWIEGRDRVGVTLQRLNDDIDAGEIVGFGQVDVSECTTLWEVYDKQYDLKTELLAEGIENLRDPSFDTVVPEDLGAYYPLTKRRSPLYAGKILFKNLHGRYDFLKSRFGNRLVEQ